MQKFREIYLFCFTTVLAVSNFAHAGDVLNSNERLENGGYINSPNGRYTLIMQTDGSLVMYRSDGTIRYSMNKKGTWAIMQSDGNFVEYAGPTALWSTGTWNCCNKPGWPAPRLRITDDGDLRIESLGPAPVWQIGADPTPSGAAVAPIKKVYPSGTPPSSVPALPSIPQTDNTAGMQLYQSRY